MLERQPDFPLAAVLSRSDDLLGFLAEVRGEFETVNGSLCVPHHQHRLLGVEGNPVKAAVAARYNFLKINFHNKIGVQGQALDWTCLQICLYLLTCRSNTLTPPSPVTRANTVLEYGAQLISVT